MSSVSFSAVLFSVSASKSDLLFFFPILSAVYKGFCGAFALLRAPPPPLSLFAYNKENIIIKITFISA